MDHPALFNAVKARDVDELHRVLGPTLKDFGTYKVVHWQHAYEGVVTSLNALPGVQGYQSLRWAEGVVYASFQDQHVAAPDPYLTEYIYKLRAALLVKALKVVQAHRACLAGPGFNRITCANSLLYWSEARPYPSLYDEGW